MRDGPSRIYCTSYFLLYSGPLKVGLELERDPRPTAADEEQAATGGAERPDALVEHLSQYGCGQPQNRIGPIVCSTRADVGDAVVDVDQQHVPFGKLPGRLHRSGDVLAVQEQLTQPIRLTCEAGDIGTGMKLKRAPVIRVRVEKAIHLGGDVLQLVGQLGHRRYRRFQFQLVDHVDIAGMSGAAVLESAHHLLIAVGDREHVGDDLLDSPLLVAQAKRRLRRFWPRSDAHLYAELKRLVERGHADAEVVEGRRRHATRYTITPAGRAALQEWLGTEPAPPAIEVEGLVRLLVGDQGTAEDLRAAIESTGRQTRELWSESRVILEDLVTTGGPFPQRLHLTERIVSLYGEFLRLVIRWCDETLAEMDMWPDTHDIGVTPAGRERLERLLALPDP